MSIVRLDVVGAVGLLLLADPANAEPNRVVKGVVYEAAIAANAGLAAASPRAYGLVAAVLFPLGLLNSNSRENTTTTLATLAAAEALCAYDIFIADPNEDSGTWIFAANVIGFHVCWAVELITAHLTRDRNLDRKMSLRFEPIPRGGALSVSRGF